MKQSPIDIKSADETYDSDLGAFSLKNYDEKLNMSFTATNTGHSLKVGFTEKVYNVSGGGLKDIYTTVQFHLHWGSDNSKGSEHKMNGKSYAAEVSGSSSSFHFLSVNCSLFFFLACYAVCLALRIIFVTQTSPFSLSYNLTKFFHFPLKKNFKLQATQRSFPGRPFFPACPGVKA